MNLHIVVVLVLAATACRGGDRSAPSGISPGTAPSTSSAVSPPSVATVQPAPATTETATPVADECSRGQPIAPGTLAVTWPARVGTRVRFKSHVEVALDVMDVVVVGAGRRFVVVAGPDQLWQGDKERTFTVMGSKAVSLGGRTTLPQLLLEPECSP
jgi:hypothetical protein